MARSDPASVAAAVVNQNRSPVLDTAGLKRDLIALQAANPALAPALEQAVLAQLSPREQGEFLRTGAGTTPLAANDPGPSTATMVADLAQMTLDLTGIVDPTPISDGANAVISLGRMGGALWNGEWGAAGGHLLNGAISVVGFIPALGDLAKAGKIGNWAETVANAVTMAARNPAMRATLEAPLRELAEVVGKVPQSAIDALPAGARESFARMKTQLDEFVSGGARQVDTIALRQFDNAADFNRAANNAAPNTRYEYGTYSYTTDANGRVSVAEGTIDLTPAGRNDPDLQRQIGNEGRPTDVGFHLIGDRFNGQTNRLNVVQGNGVPLGDGLPNLNQGPYKRFENQIAEIASQPGNRVEVRVTANYDPANTSVRPDSFTAQYRVNGGAWRTANGGEPFVNR
jgi:hypothetical protein